MLCMWVARCELWSVDLVKFIIALFLSFFSSSSGLLYNATHLHPVLARALWRMLAKDSGKNYTCCSVGSYWMFGRFRQYLKTYFKVKLYTLLCNTKLIMLTVKKLDVVLLMWYVVLDVVLTFNIKSYFFAVFKQHVWNKNFTICDISLL